MNYQEKIKKLQLLNTKEIIEYLENKFSDCEDVLQQLEHSRIDVEYINSWKTII